MGLNPDSFYDDTVKGLLRSIGDAGATPSNTTGATLLKLAESISNKLDWIYRSYSAYNSSTAAALTVSLDLGNRKGRLQVEVWVKSSAAADFTVQVSRNNTDWRDTDTISLGAAGEDHRGYSNAYPYIRVTTDAANDNEIEIAASR